MSSSKEQLWKDADDAYARWHAGNPFSESDRAMSWRAGYVSALKDQRRPAETPPASKTMSHAEALRRLRAINEWLNNAGPANKHGVWLDHVDDAFMAAWDDADAFDLTSPADETTAERIGHERYEYLRTLSPQQFNELWERNIKTGIAFDRLVDAARAPVKASEPLPNDAFRWICIHCNTVSGVNDENCLGCGKPRYPTLAAQKTKARQVGCEGEDGLLRVHDETETCDVCKPADVTEQRCPHCKALAINGQTVHGFNCPEALKQLGVSTPRTSANE